MSRPRKRTVGIVLLVVVALAVAGWPGTPSPSRSCPRRRRRSRPRPTVTFTETDGRLEWAPADGDYDTGLVVYPGGKVPAAAYGPLAQADRREGYLVVITPMPFNLAVFGIGTADAVIEAHPEVETWAHRRALARAARWPPST